MKAAQFSRFGGPEVLQIVDLPDPRPGRAEVRIKVRAAGVNASDWKKRQGLMDQQLPQTLGYEAAGVVDEIGDGVSGVTVGDRVFGARRTELRSPSSQFSYWAPIPDVLDYANAAAIPAAAETAARALDQLGVTAGSTLLINGASGSSGAPLSNLPWRAAPASSEPGVQEPTTRCAPWAPSRWLTATGCPATPGDRVVGRRFRVGRRWQRGASQTRGTGRIAGPRSHSRRLRRRAADGREVQPG